MLQANLKRRSSKPRLGPTSPAMLTGLEQATRCSTTQVPYHLESDHARLALTVLDDGTASKSRKGTVRNTDSFFKDDNTETRKINLTPSLLRDDSSGSVKSLEAKEVCR